MQWVLMLLAGLAALIVMAPRLLKWLFGRMIKAEVEAARKQTTAADDPLLADMDNERPVLLYFTADWCGPCRTTQTPIIEALMRDLGDRVQLKKVDTDASPDAKERWQVQSLPRTVVLRPDFTVHATNVGIAQGAVLRDQLTEAAQTASDTPPTVQHQSLDDTGNQGFKFKFLD